MKITWFGQSYFQILTGLYKKNQQTLSIIIDPFTEKIGLKPPKNQADILLISHDKIEKNEIAKSVSGKPFLIDAPGEYEIKGISFRAIPSFSKGGGRNLIFKIDTENLRICHLGVLNQKELNNEQLESIGLVDILMVPVGGEEVISAKEAKEIIAEIEPKVVIPMYYFIPKLKIKIETLDNFLKIMGEKGIPPQDQLKIQKGDKILEGESFTIIVLNPK